MPQTTNCAQSAAWFALFSKDLMAGTEGAPLSDAQVRSLSPLALAYIGDAVYELFVRGVYLMPPKRSQVYHCQVVAHVRAEQQAHYLELLQGHLTEDEQEIARRGRNAASHRKQRASSEDYQKATGLEALVGYLYLTDAQRLQELLGYLPLDYENSKPC